MAAADLNIEEIGEESIDESGAFLPRVIYSTALSSAGPVTASQNLVPLLFISISYERTSRSTRGQHEAFLVHFLKLYRKNSDIT